MFRLNHTVRIYLEVEYQRYVKCQIPNDTFQKGLEAQYSTTKSSSNHFLEITTLFNCQPLCATINFNCLNGQQQWESLNSSDYYHINANYLKGCPAGWWATSKSLGEGTGATMERSSQVWRVTSSNNLWWSINHTADHAVVVQKEE